MTTAVTMHMVNIVQSEIVSERIQNIIYIIYLQLFAGGIMSYLRHLCLFAHSGVQRLLYCVLVLFFFVLRILCCQFLLIV